MNRSPQCKCGQIIKGHVISKSAAERGMKMFIIVLLCAALLAGCGADEVTLCPDDSPPGEDCVKLHQLLSHTKSNTTFKFLPASFKLESDTVISIANVSNISFIASGRAEVTCGKTFGLFFQNVSGLIVRNVTFVNCGALWNYRKDPWHGTCGVGLSKCAEITLDGLEFISGLNYGVCASNIYGHFTISNSVFGNYTYGCGFYYQQFEPTLDKFSSIHGQPIVTQVSNILTPLILLPPLLTSQYILCLCH